ncbi:MAG: hypothetical protein ABI315_09050 [Bacteroidia bacterium]
MNYDWEYEWGLGKHDLPTITISLSFKDLKEYLNDNSKELLFAPLIIPQNKLFKGYIGGKYPISALVKQASDSTKITYSYDNNKIPINWNGVIDKNKYFLKENLTAAAGVRAQIELSFFSINGKIQGVGTWKDLKNGNILTIELFEE